MHTLSQAEKRFLERKALAARKNVLRLITAGKSGHVGGALSIIDTITALYFKIMKVDPQNPKDENRDRFVLSAGHKCLAIYAVLAEAGFFEKELLDTYGQLGSKLPGHPDMHKIPGLESNTGALGHGLSIGVGMAMGLAMNQQKGVPRVYVAMGDGELAEGSNWEAAAAASHHKLDNLMVFADRNGLQIGGNTVDVMTYEPLEGRWSAFGWAVRVIDGHDMNAIVETTTSMPFEKGKPSCVILNTIKSKGLSFAEGDPAYHYWKTTPEQLEIAEKDLAAIEARLAS
ncbi:MAG: transketolase [Desulfobacteraceae bacterium]|jgi:transketolase|nr:transketolase [Desulfobacteraceae bacterium]